MRNVFAGESERHIRLSSEEKSHNRVAPGDEDGILEARFRIDREDNARGSEIGPYHFLDADGEGLVYTALEPIIKALSCLAFENALILHFVTSELLVTLFLLAVHMVVVRAIPGASFNYCTSD